MSVRVDPAVWEASFAQSPDPCFAYAVDGPGRFTVAIANQAWIDATGIPAEAFGTPLDQLVPAEMLGYMTEVLQRCVEQGSALSFEETLQFRGNTRFWRTRLMPLSIDGAVRYVVGFAHDYSELRNTSVALAESEAKFRRLVENASDVIYRIALEPKVKVEYLSPAVEQLTGYPPERLYGDSSIFLELIEPDDRPQVMRRMQELQGEPGPILSRWRRRDGSVRWVEARSVAVRNAEGRIIAREGVARDMTEQKLREQERAALEARLQQTQKLESLGVLAGGIAHDFNNLLTGILGHASLVRLNASGSDTLKEHADHIEAAAQRAADLCRQMLAYSGKGRFAVRRLDLDELVRDTTQLLKLSIAKSTTLKLELGAGGTAIEADSTQLQQVIMNLVLNASEACEPQQGVVTITTGEAMLTGPDLQDALGGAELREGKYVVLEVQDVGTGMTPETQAKIFDPFFTTKFTGRGLGLSAVLGIVRGHAGAIRVRSEPGRGTTFQVLLPAAEGEAERTAPSERAPVFRGSGRVLVVDDEEIVRQVTGRILEALGFRVVMAANGRQAVELFRRGDEPFALVLMDLTMPELDGVAAFDQLRRLDPRVPVLLMSGYDEQDAVARFRGNGLAGFLQKPFTADTLVERIKQALRPA